MKTFPGSMTAREFLDWLRDAGIKGNMPQGFLDCVDAIDGDADAADDLEKAEQKIEDLREALKTLVAAIKKDPREIEDEMAVAEDALEATKS